MAFICSLRSCTGTSAIHSMIEFVTELRTEAAGFQATLNPFQIRFVAIHTLPRSLTTFDHFETSLTKLSGTYWPLKSPYFLPSGIFSNPGVFLEPKIPGILAI